LRRTPADLEALLPISLAIGLVKGAYREPENIAFPKKRDTDRAYLELSERMFQDGLPVFGTHDLQLIGQIRSRAHAT
jgi:proline dehydrogenase